MSQYIITIVPVVDEQFTGSGAQTVIRVETAGEQTTVKELTIRASDDSGLVGGEVPEVDFELLLRALTPRVARAGAPTAARPGGDPRPTATHPATTHPATTHPATTHPATTVPAAVASAASSTRSRRSESPVPARRAGAAATTPPKLAHLRAGRAYRRAPDNAALEETYLRTGSIAGVAEHFGVPVHTAQGWISRMRQRNVEHSAG